MKKILLVLFIGCMIGCTNRKAHHNSNEIMASESDDSLQYEYAELFSLDEAGPLTSEWFVGWSWIPAILDPASGYDIKFKKSTISSSDTLQWISERIKSAKKDSIEHNISMPTIILYLHGKDKVDTLALSGVAYANSELQYNRTSFCDTTLTLGIVRHLCLFNENWKSDYNWCREHKWRGY